MKGEKREPLPDSWRKVKPAPEPVKRAPRKRGRKPTLSGIEFELMAAWSAEGFSDRVVAAAFGVSPATVLRNRRKQKP